MNLKLIIFKIFNYVLKNKKFAYAAKKVGFLYLSSNFFIRAILSTFLIPFYIIKTYISFYGKFILPNVSISVTNKCNLNCDGCNNLIPFYKNPENPSTTEQIKDLKRLLDIVDHIGILETAGGGEPFLNRKFGDILEFLLTDEKYSKKFDKITITTNGTVIPDKKSMKVISEHLSRVRIYVSYYGDKSDKLINFLEKRNIPYSMEKDAEWYDLGNVIKYNRNQKELFEMFSSCLNNKNCNTYVDGKYHLCQTSGHGMNLNLIPKKNDELVDLRVNSENKEDIAKKRKELKKLLSKKCISSCDYCNQTSPILVGKKENIINKQGE